MKRTLLILGAGASKDVFDFFPTGYELIKDIAFHLTVDCQRPVMDGEGPCVSSLMNELIRSFTLDQAFIGQAIPYEHFERRQTQSFLAEVLKAKTALWKYVMHFEHKRPRNRLAPKEAISIDEFVDKQFCDEPLIKEIVQYSISYLLCGCEGALKDRLDEANPEVVHANWIAALAGKLKVYSSDEIEANLKVVTLNYERSFEYLFDQYRTGSGRSAIPSGCVEHFYGTLGSMAELPFGSANDETRTVLATDGRFKLMFPYREQKDWSTEQPFDQVLVLGFGFDSTNIDRLRLQELTPATIAATGRGVNMSRREELMNAERILFPKVKYNLDGRECERDMTCTEVIEAHEF